MSTTFKQIEKQLKDAGIDAPCTGKNEDGETLIIEYGKDDTGLFYRVTTCQHNNWLRINTYYECGDVTETYKKDKGE